MHHTQLLDLIEPMRKYRGMQGGRINEIDFQPLRRKMLLICDLVIKDIFLVSSNHGGISRSKSTTSQ